jgi:RHS repeat-associated protein
VNGVNDKGTLTWNPNGTLGTLVVADSLSGTSDSQTCNYYYDDLARLGGKDSNGYSVDCGTKWQQLFTFDPFGNISKSGTASFLPTYSTATNHFATISGLSVSYDNNGNLLTDNLNTYTWSAYGNPGSINSITLVYDALGRMVEQQNGSAYTQMLYSPVGKTAIMNGQTLSKAFVGLPGGGTVIYKSSGLAYYRHTDWLGSSRLTSTTSRTVYSDSSYAPFGEQYAVSGTADSSFTGQDSDTVSSLYDFTYREHSPSQGRWVSPDPAGVAAVDPTSPQSWNRYAYVLNNPMSLVDPLGLYCNWGNGDYDDEDGGASEADCESQGGTWVPGLSPGEVAGAIPPGTTIFHSQANGLEVYASMDAAGLDTTYIVPFYFFGGNGAGAANNGTWNWIKNAARKIGNYIPVICGAGVYNTGGLQLTGGAATVTVRNIQVADTQAGYQSGTFGEINFGEGLQGGFGQALYSGGGKENYLFGGVGLNLPTVTEVSVSGFVAHTEGDPFLSNSIGIDFDGGVSVLGGSAAGYLNTSSLTSCLSGH